MLPEDSVMGERGLIFLLFCLLGGTGVSGSQGWCENRELSLAPLTEAGRAGERRPDLRNDDPTVGEE